MATDQAGSGGPGYSQAGTNDVSALLKTDADDESLRKYKEQLLGAAAQGDLGDKNDPRKLIVTEFRVMFNNSTPDIVFSLDSMAGMMLLKENGMSIKEGIEYKFRISFRVQHEILNGLKFCNKIKKMGVTNSDDLMIGSYAPQSAPHVFEFPRHGWMDAPKGMMYRGNYTSQDKFVRTSSQSHTFITIQVDSDGVTHLEYSYPLKITK